MNTAPTLRVGKEICKAGLFFCFRKEMMERNHASHRRFRDGNGTDIAQRVWSAAMGFRVPLSQTLFSVAEVSKHGICPDKCRKTARYA